jgi:sec-independent protein translocase protein TatA
MGFTSIWHWVIVLLIVLILFGRGRIAEMMGDFGKGIASFKKGLNETEETAAKAARIEPPAAAPAEPPAAAPAPAPTEKSDGTGT